MATTPFYYAFSAIFDIVAVLNTEEIIMISGLNGGNFILSSMAKERVKSGLLDRATIEGSKGEYTVIFDGSEWEGKPLVLSSSRQPYEARVFKSIDWCSCRTTTHRLKRSFNQKHHQIEQ